MSNSQTILVTGINGFVGNHLARELKDQGHIVIGVGLDTSLATALKPYISRYIGSCDLTHKSAVEKLPLSEVDSIINLAGLAQMGASFESAKQYMQTNVLVHTNVAEHLLSKRNRATRLLAISSGTVYESHQPMPLTEDSTLITESSPYAMSKVAMEKALLGHKKDGLNVIIARPFNHIGPGQAEGFLVPDLTKRLLSSDVLTVGNLKTKRDYTDVRDVVKAYALLATLPELHHTVYNICSGRSVSGETVLKSILKELDKKSVSLKVDQSRMRPNDPQDIVGDNSRIEHDTGWQAHIPLEQTIRDFVAWYKQQSA